MNPDKELDEFIEADMEWAKERRDQDQNPEFEGFDD
jgi:hypothetical protein